MPTVAPGTALDPHPTRWPTLSLCLLACLQADQVCVEAQKLIEHQRPPVLWLQKPGWWVGVGAGVGGGVGVGGGGGGWGKGGGGGSGVQRVGQSGAASAEQHGARGQCRKACRHSAAQRARQRGQDAHAPAHCGGQCAKITFLAVSVAAYWSAKMLYVTTRSSGAAVCCRVSACRGATAAGAGGTPTGPQSAKPPSPSTASSPGSLLGRAGVHSTRRWQPTSSGAGV